MNGRETEVPTGLSVAELVESLGLGDRRVAVEINRSVVSRAEWPARKLDEADHVEIVQFVGGG